MTELELRTLKVAISDRLNNILCEMKPGYDDSITGFNEAWDAVGNLIDDKIKQLAPQPATQTGMNWELSEETKRELAEIDKRAFR
jgi:hypothetical protein